MIKKIALAGLAVSSLFAVDMQVKKGDVVLNINTQKVSLAKGTVQELSEGTTLCYVGGDGKVVIPSYKKQLKKAGRCFTIPLSNNSATSYLADIQNKANVAFWDASENVRHGAGTKGETKFENDDAFVLTADQKELIIYGKEFGPLPVTVSLKDKDGKEVLSFENEDSEITLVRIGKEQLKTGMRIEVYNGFEEFILNKKIIVED
ncbi:hypothetical protein [Sulfurimonas sp.]|uniref:hypothetical protein n=1 Tax=Sulfurimonas sp. TaxID=2022749 RepID=UPI003D11F45C